MSIVLSNGVTATAVRPVPSVVTTVPTMPTLTVAPAARPDPVSVAGIAVYAPATTAGSDPLTFPFLTPAATWTVRHGLGRYPLVQLLDLSGSQFDADVEYPDVNTVVITLAVPTAGSALVI